MSLQAMLMTQWELQKEFDPRADDDDPQLSCEYMKDMSTALCAEVMELLEETGWKPWTTSWHVNVEQARAEWIDAWHFMMNLANKLGMNSTMIEEMYGVKAEVNRQRIRNKYDGVSTKCPGCKRALDDPQTPCYIMKVTPEDPGSGVWCFTKKAQVAMPGV